MSKKQTRVTCWMDEDIILAFNMIHPVHGATTKFIRSCFAKYIRQNKEKVKNLFHELDLEDTDQFN